MLKRWMECSFYAVSLTQFNIELRYVFRQHCQYTKERHVSPWQTKPKILQVLRGKNPHPFNFWPPPKPALINLETELKNSRQEMVYKFNSELNLLKFKVFIVEQVMYNRRLSSFQNATSSLSPLQPILCANINMGHGGKTLGESPLPSILTKL